MKKKAIIIIGSLIGILCIIGVSYSYWRLTLSQTGINRIASTCLSLSLTNEENAINLVNAYPLLDEEGRQTTPYSFTVENTCDLFAS